MAHKVFISYSHIDSQIAFAMCNKLEDDGAKCWIAPRDIGPGKSWAGEIANAVPKSKVMILILSESSNASSQVLREVEIAVHNKVIILPVRIEDVMPTDGMSYYLATMQWIDVKGDKIDSKISMISKKTRNILREFEDDEEEKQRKIELLEKQRIERERIAKAEAAAKVAEELLRQQEKERILKEQIELKEKQRLDRELQAKARIDAKNANKRYKLQEKEKLQQKQKELAENERQLKIEKKAGNKKTAKEDKSHVATKKTNAKKIVAVLVSVAILIAAGSTLFLLRDTIFNQDSKTIQSTNKIFKTVTPAPESTTSVPEEPMPEETLSMSAPQKLLTVEDFGWDANTVVEISDPELLECILLTFQEMGEDIGGTITVEDMLKLESLAILSSEDGGIGWLQGFEGEYLPDNIYLYTSDKSINSLKGLEYARNLKYLAITNKELENIDALTELTRLELLLLSGNRITDTIPLLNLKNLVALNLGGNELLENINSLKNMQKLEYLVLEACENISNFSVFVELSAIETLWIGRTQFGHLSLLDSMVGLTSLSLEGTNISIEDLSNFQNKGKIQGLEIGNLNLNDISFLSEFKNLSSVGFGDNNIQNISVLAKLEYLNWIIMNNNNISDLSPIKDMKLHQLRLDESLYASNRDIINMFKEEGCRIDFGDE
ncbi:MAG: TIR domain-containing protein [Clostridiales bacterium]|nr:TIR domain-containing protein [Clostridiales bacterium]